jgi:hypothetical protein
MSETQPVTCTVDGCERESIGEASVWKVEPAILKANEPLTMVFVPLCGEHMEALKQLGRDFAKHHPLKG